MQLGVQKNTMSSTGAYCTTSVSKDFNTQLSWCNMQMRILHDRKLSHWKRQDVYISVYACVVVTV